MSPGPRLALVATVRTYSLCIAGPALPIELEKMSPRMHIFGYLNPATCFFAFLVSSSCRSGGFSVCFRAVAFWPEARKRLNIKNSGLHTSKYHN